MQMMHQNRYFLLLPLSVALVEYLLERPHKLVSNYFGRETLRHRLAIHDCQIGFFGDFCFLDIQKFVAWLEDVLRVGTC